MGFVLHDDGRFPTFCSFYSSNSRDQLPVYPDWEEGPRHGSPLRGVCRNCGRRGFVYEVPPLGADVVAATAEFTGWLRAALDGRHADDASHGITFSPTFQAGRALLDLHVPTEVFQVQGGTDEAPRRVQVCKECGKDGYPCATLRTLAEPHQFDMAGWKKEWAL